ncbi:putative zinc finger, CCHC-type containing protein [Tanacetum coccineum]
MSNNNLFSRSSSSSFRQSSASKMDQLYEISYVPDDSRILAPVRSTSALKFVRHENGLVEIKFSSSQPKSDNVFPTGIHMITPIDQEPAQEIKHIWWEVCNCESYLDEAAKIDDDDEDPPKKRNPTEATLNWQSENAIAQNKFLVKILSQQGVSFDPQPLPRSYIHTTSPSLTIWASEQRRLKPSTKKEPTFSQESQSIADIYYTIDIVIKRFLTRLQGCLKDWYHSLGEYRQLQIQQSISPEAFMSIIYSEFIGSPWEHTAHAREEILKMKRSSKKWKFIRKKKQRGRTSDRCFICQKRGHFARNYQDKNRSQALIQALNQVEPVDISDLESLYSLDDEPSDSVLCTIAYSDFSSDDDSDTDLLESDYDFGVHMINPIPRVLPIQEDQPLPLTKVHLLMDAYAKPISIIAFFDTGSSVSILNLNILLDYYWKPHH